ncbi:MAG: hypothetical protein U0413_00320 [Candidatus Saccharimonadales bacterium]|jgi:hypothetical protein
MKPKKTSKQSSKDEAWQKKVVKQVKTEKVELGDPNGKERFDRVIQRANKLFRKK